MECAPADWFDFPWFRSFVLLQAAILLVASLLKVWLFWTDEFSDIKSGFPASILLLVAFVEFGVACTLFWSRQLGTCWLMLVPLYTTFLVVSGVRYVAGYVGCGCLGALEIPRWILPVNNLLVVGLMLGLLAGPKSRRRLGLRKCLLGTRAKLSDPFNLGGFVSALLVAFFLLAWPFVSTTRAWSSIVWERPFPPERYEFGELSTGRRQLLTVNWKNTSDLPVRFIGSQVSCTCMGIVGDLPLVAPHSDAVLTINVRPRMPGQFHQRVVCFVDHPDQGRVFLDIFGTAVSPSLESSDDR